MATRLWNALRAKRKANPHPWTVAAVARRCGITASRLYLVLNGRTGMPDAGSAGRLAVELDVDCHAVPIAKATGRPPKR